MNLQELSSALPKQWLNIKANSIETKTLDADSITADSFAADSLVIDTTAGVANPAAGKIAIYADLAGNIKTNDSVGTAEYLIAQSVPATAGKFPIYDASGVKLEDSKSAPTDYALLTGATFTGDVSASHVYSSSVPVCSWRGGMTGSWASIGPGSAAETDMISGGRTGSLTIADAAASGFVLKMKFIALFTSGAATVTTLRFKVNGTTVLTSTIPAAVVVNKYYQLDYNLQVLENARDRILIFSTLTRSEQTPLIEAGLADGVWNPAGNNTVSVTLQFSDVNGTWVTQFWDLWSSAPQTF